MAGCARNLSDRLVASDEGVRQAALAKLEAGGLSLRREVAPFLAERLGDINGNVRRRAIQALSRLGPDAVNPLVRTLLNADPKARAAAAEALGLLDSDAKSALGPLVEAERDPDENVRRWAAASLERVKTCMSPDDLRVFDMLYGRKEVVAPVETKAAPLFAAEDPRRGLQALRSAGAQGKTEAILALVELGPAAVPALLDALGGGDEKQRDGAARALRLLTEEDADAALVSFLKEGDPSAREAFAQAFNGAERSEARALAARTTNESLCVRLEAVRALGALGPAARPAAEALTAAMDDPSPAVRRAALRALPRVFPPPPGGIPEVLLKRLRTEWSEAAGFLAQGRVEAALARFAASRRDEYRSTFLSLGRNLPDLGRSLNVDLAFGGGYGGRVVLEGRAFIGGVRQDLRILFVKDAEERWKIREF